MPVQRSRQLSQQVIAGQRMRKVYLHHVTEFLFRQLDRGVSSPYVVLCSGLLVSVAGWRLSEYYLASQQEKTKYKMFTSRVPMLPIHDAYWGLSPLPMGKCLTHEDTSQSSSSALCHPQGVTEEMERAMQRPRMVHSEMSELHSHSTGGNRSDTSSGLDLACMELREYDQKLRDDAYYRSVHYVAYDPSPSALREGTTAARLSLSSSSLHTSPDQSVSCYSASSSPSTGVIHGIVKCKSVNAQDQCIPAAGHLEDERSRKLMLTLGPVHVLRDAAQLTLPLRFTLVKQPCVNTLILGLHSGELPRWLSNAFPNFKVDVVEEDSSLVRLCKRFMGFQESSNLAVTIANPAEYVRCAAALASHENNVKTRKDYDLVLVDAVDGAGRLRTEYARLEFINHVRNSMSSHGCVAVTIPNTDASFLYHVVQNWRMAFHSRTILLAHCYTVPYTILMTFQDTATRGKSNFGTVSNVTEFQDLLRSHIVHYGVQRIPFDLVHEVGEHNFSIIQPGKVYEWADYLPRTHPERVRAAPAKQSTSFYASWWAYARQLSYGLLSPGQHADMQLREGVSARHQ